MSQVHKIHLVLDHDGYAIQEEWQGATRRLEGPWPSLLTAVEQFKYLGQLAVLQDNSKHRQLDDYIERYLKFPLWGPGTTVLKSKPQYPISLESFTL
jgi:hypothetical protein